MHKLTTVYKVNDSLFGYNDCNLSPTAPNKLCMLETPTDTTDVPPTISILTDRAVLICHRRAVTKAPELHNNNNTGSLRCELTLADKLSVAYFHLFPVCLGLKNK